MDADIDFETRSSIVVFTTSMSVTAFMFKEIRHLANTLMKKANITADKRMAMTGHKTIQANEVYTHPTGGDTVDAGRALSKYGPPEF